MGIDDFTNYDLPVFVVLYVVMYHYRIPPFGVAHSTEDRTNQYRGEIQPQLE